MYRQGIVVLLAVGLAPAPAAGAEQSETLAQVFEARYQQLVQKIKVGALPAETEREAKAIWYALRKDIIALDAEVETLKLEVMAQQGAREEAALEQLGEKISDRERRLMRAIQDLDRLAGKAASPVPAVTAGAGASKPAEDNNEPPQKTSIRALDIEIELAPEDLTKGDME